MCHSNEYEHLQPEPIPDLHGSVLPGETLNDAINRVYRETKHASKPTRIVVSGHRDTPLPLARVVSSHVDERGLTIVVEPRDAEAAAIIRDYRVDVGSWPPMPFDWQEMAATAGRELERKPSRLERLRHAFRMES